MTDIRALIESAETFPDHLLVAQLIEIMDRALAINNSGLFKFAGILMDELDRRGYGSQDFRDYRDLIRLAVARAEARVAKGNVNDDRQS